MLVKTLLFLIMAAITSCKTSSNSDSQTKDLVSDVAPLSRVKYRKQLGFDPAITQALVSSGLDMNSICVWLGELALPPGRLVSVVTIWNIPCDQISGKPGLATFEAQYTPYFQLYRITETGTVEKAAVGRTTTLARDASSIVSIRDLCTNFYSSKCDLNIAGGKLESISFSEPGNEVPEPTPEKSCSKCEYESGQRSSFRYFYRRYYKEKHLDISEIYDSPGKCTQARDLDTWCNATESAGEK